METTEHRQLCDDCGDEIGLYHGPNEGWELEDGRTVCHDCCVSDTRAKATAVIFAGLAQENNEG